jgi:MFS superfamily sulfate permease-like transporter
MSKKTAIVLKLVFLGCATVAVAYWTANLRPDLCVCVAFLHVAILLGLAWKILIPQASRFIINEFNRTDDFPSDNPETHPADAASDLNKTNMRQQISPARFSAMVGIGGSIVVMVVISLIEGDGQFFWHWRAPVIGVFAGCLGAIRAWGSAKARNACRSGNPWE